MKLCLRIAVLLFLVTGTLTQELSLEDGLDEIKTTTQKPKEKPKAPEQPKKDGELDLWDAFGPDEPQPEKPKKPSPGDSDSNGFNLGDAVNPGPTTKPDKPAVNPPKGGGGGGKFDDSDLFDVSDGDYKPDGGRSGGRAMGPQGGADQPQGGADQPQDPDFLWGHILKMLNANMPEEFYVWMSNLKQILTPLLERAMDLLQAVQ
ncbi:CD99 molecule isoform X3 [Pundamilia nyererei]|uniref:CD99 molecule isoform X3 n=1 Tax=Pundamilia nyererei TaxID=303518 RepID=A0A9Y3RV16_9CICH|nr:PREDICTED: CD99 antigen-like protein 2 isoform X3 [Pundamilia nyererei]